MSQPMDRLREIAEIMNRAFFTPGDHNTNVSIGADRILSLLLADKAALEVERDEAVELADIERQLASNVRATLLKSEERRVSAEARATASEARVGVLVGALEIAEDALDTVYSWAGQQCPCGPPDYEYDEPKICPLCLADRDDTVNGFCKAVPSTLPPQVHGALNRARSFARSALNATSPGIGEGR